MFAVGILDYWWRLFGPAAYESSSWTDGGIYKTHPAAWQMTTAVVFVCCAVLLLGWRSGRFKRLLIFGPALFGSFAAIFQMHWMFLGMASEWIGPSPVCEDVVRYALLSTHIGLGGTLLLLLAHGISTRFASRASDI